jgi:hypothetical protein
MASDDEAIRSVIMDYIEGWYLGDVTRMKKALHPDLAKRGYHVVPSTKTINLVHVGASNMFAYTEAHLGKLDAGVDMAIKVDIWDVCDNTASAKVTSVKFVDHVQLARFGDDWRIVNVLWEPAVAG